MDGACFSRLATSRTDRWWRRPTPCSRCLQAGGLERGARAASSAARAAARLAGVRTRPGTPRSPTRRSSAGHSLTARWAPQTSWGSCNTTKINYEGKSIPDDTDSLSEYKISTLSLGRRQDLITHTCSLYWQEPLLTHIMAGGQQRGGEGRKDGGLGPHFSHMGSISSRPSCEGHARGMQCTCPPARHTHNSSHPTWNSSSGTKIGRYILKLYSSNVRKVLLKTLP